MNVTFGVKVLLVIPKVMLASHRECESFAYAGHHSVLELHILFALLVPYGFFEDNFIDVASNRTSGCQP